MRRDRIVACAVSVTWGLVVAVAAYAITRAIQVILREEPVPTAVTWSAHTGYYWRIGVVSYAGGITAFVMMLVTRTGVEGPARALVGAVGVAAVLLVLQAALFP